MGPTFITAVHQQSHAPRDDPLLIQRVTALGAFTPLFICTFDIGHGFLCMCTCARPADIILYFRGSALRKGNGEAGVVVGVDTVRIMGGCGGGCGDRRAVWT